MSETKVCFRFRTERRYNQAKYSAACRGCSFYPQLKQYLEPHEAPTGFMLLGWGMWIVGALINVVFVERLPHKLWLNSDSYKNLYHKDKSVVKIVEESLFSLENGLFMVTTVLVMIR